LFEDDQMIAVRAYERAEDRALHLSSLEPLEPFETTCLFGRCDRVAKCIDAQIAPLPGFSLSSSFFLSFGINSLASARTFDFLLA